jgi:hypothetical protein
MEKKPMCLQIFYYTGVVVGALSLWLFQQYLKLCSNVNRRHNQSGDGAARANLNI